MARSRSIPPSSQSAATAGLGFLLSQVGAHSSARFAERLEPLGFKPPHVGVMRVIGESDGLSQQALGEKLGMFPSRLVGMIDDLEKRGLVERRNSPSDRRSYALYLTEGGCAALDQFWRIAREHQQEICAALNEPECAQLTDLLRRIAAQQGLTPGVHPGYRKMVDDEK